MYLNSFRDTFRAVKTCAALATATLLLTAGATKAQTPAALTPMQIGTFPIATNLPDQIANNRGIFRKNGLDVTMVGPAMAGATAVALMTGGKLQSYFQDIPSVMIANSNGAKLTFAACNMPGTIYFLVARGDIGLPANGDFATKFQALKGKTVGVIAIGSGTDRTIQIAMAASGVADKDITRVGVGAPAAAISQMNAGRVDAYITGSISGAYQVTKGVKDAIVYVDFSDPSTPIEARLFSSGGWMVPADWAAANPDAVKNYRKALEESYAWIKANQDEAAKLMSLIMYNGEEMDIATKSVKYYAEHNIARNPTLKCTREPFDAAYKMFVQYKVGPDNGHLTFEDLTLPSSR